ncbi:Hypothetical predicted protein [Olea europaea subsp. europaea]|uniref:Uncharacterized protein n=1 Tax=Olea europaea subsp. europaea TaxID=158383 RepID=A0A8S0RZE8_OLEEU|nr:Hypothetical predicted protein [Olea europaea subsp. europaea]
MQPDFQAFLGSLWARCAGHVRDASWPRQGHKQIFNQTKEGWCTGHVMRPGTFLGILDNFWDTVYMLNSREVMATARMQPDFRAFFGRSRPGHIQALCLGTTGTVPDFQAVVGSILISRHFYIVYWTWCTGHGLDAAGMQPDFQAFLDSFWDTVFCGYDVQPIFGTRPSLGKDTALFSGISWQFLGLGVQAMFGTRRGMFVGTVYKPCPGRIQAAAGTSPNFQAFLGNFWDSVCRPCPGRVMAKAGTEPACLINSGQFRDHGVQAMSRTRQFVDIVWRLSPGRILAAIETRPDFQAFLVPQINPSFAFRPVPPLVGAGTVHGSGDGDDEEKVYGL